MKEKIFILRSFGETIDFAEYLGWVDTYGGSEGEDWEPEDVDACEDEALKSSLNSFRLNLRTFLIAF